MVFSHDIASPPNPLLPVCRHLQLAIAGDSELSRLLADATIREGGVTPHIEPALLPPRSRRRQQQPDEEEGEEEEDARQGY